MILDDIKAFLVQNNLVQESSVKYDYDAAKGAETVVLHLYDNAPCDLARRSSVRITVKFSDLEFTRNTTFAMHDLFFPEDSFQKSILINGKRMHAKLNKGPCYQGFDPSKRHNYVLDITFTYNR